MVTLKDQTGTKKKEIVFDCETYDSLDEALTAHMHAKNETSMKVAFASRISWENDDTISFFYHDTAIVTWHRFNNSITVNTGGFMGKATQEKINFALRGHGWIGTAWNGSRNWLLHLIDPNKPTTKDDYGRTRHEYHDSVALYEGLTFDAISGVVTSTEPTVDELDFCEVIKAYRFVYEGKSKLPDISKGVSLALYDKWLDRVIKLYCEQVITWETMAGSYNYTHGECFMCDQEEEIFDRSLDEGVIKPGNFGSIKEQTLAILREHIQHAHTDDRDHLLQHVLKGDYNSTIPYLALKIGLLRPEYYLRYTGHEYTDNRNLTQVQRHTSRFLRRMLHRSIINVA